MLHGDSLFRRLRAGAASCAEEAGLTFVHPYDDPDVIAGQGTIGMEILRQHQGPLDAIFVADRRRRADLGRRGYVKRVRPEDQGRSASQPVDSDAMTRSLEAGRRVTLPHVGLFADGVAVKQVGEETFRLCARAASTR